MNQSIQTETSAVSTGNQAPAIAIISSSWHRSIVDNAVQAAAKHFVENGVPQHCIRFIEVPGAFEIPLHAQMLAQSGKYQAIVACGLVVDGGIYRHEFVASAVIDGLMQVQLTSGVPVFSAVLTPHHFHGHEEHLDFFASHFVVKGAEVAQACLQTLASLRNLSGLYQAV
jgi:6,7-dimethyl-8-ribityllumazine synthase